MADQNIGETEEMSDDSFPQDEEVTETDFNLDEEYKEDPLAPNGGYTGVIRKVLFESKNNAIRWDVVAAGNSGISMLDGETPLNGTVFFFRNWLPKPGDDKVRTKSGKSTKRQSKINMLKQFQDIMEVDMNTPEAVKESIENAEWIGISVFFQLSIDEYQGRKRNVIDKMSRLDEDIEMPEDSDEEAPF